MTDSFTEYKANFDTNPYHKVLGITALERRPSYGKIVLLKDEDTPSGIGGSVHVVYAAGNCRLWKLGAIIAYSGASSCAGHNPQECTRRGYEVRCKTRGHR